MCLDQMKETPAWATAMLESWPGPSEGTMVGILHVSWSSTSQLLGTYSSLFELGTDHAAWEFGTLELHALCLALGLPPAPKLLLGSCSALYTTWSASWSWQSP